MEPWEQRRIAQLWLPMVTALGIAMSAPPHAWGGEPSVVPAEEIARQQQDFFEKHIRPVLAERCYECHAASNPSPKAGLRLDSAAGLRRGGESGPALVPGKPDESLIIAAIRYQSYEMPPDGKLPDETVSHFVRWVQMGAPDPRKEAAPLEQASAGDSAPGASAATVHWAFRPATRPELPPVKNPAWARTAVDRFVLARLEQAGLTPSAPANPRALLRRLSYALVGLPPSAEALEQFAAAPDDEAYAAVVERLLASPQFGERWGRHWLDVARYADTKGYVFQEDRNYPQAYTYRDWVIQAFNRDLPYDQFLLAQVAADQSGDPAQSPAMGFLTLGRRFINNKHDIIDDRIDVVTRGLMGLTVTCARCHDHKYDPITMADYYALYGVFDSSREPHEAAAPLLLVDADQPSEPVVFLRGNPASRGERVPRRFLGFLSAGSPPPFQHGSGRREMAEAIASPANPLTARVWVNRVWLHLFGRGLVTTPSDLGTRSDPPSHPELLDRLACGLIESGWSTKWLIRELVLSSVYRQASDDRPEGSRVDAENRLLWRMNRRRLDFEALRDSLLLAAGHLDLNVGGPPVPLTEPPFPTRRTVYGFVERQNLPGLFRTFDFASPDTHSPARPYTTVPQQALYLMNSPFVWEQAARLARRPEVQAAGSDQGRVVNLFRCALGRSPDEDELLAARAYVEAAATAGAGPQHAAADPWRYGFGLYDAQARRVAFESLGHFTGSAWQAGPELPDARRGWVMLRANGGHPGNDPAHAAIRRWIAPRAGRLTIEGTLEHPSDQGDGVRGRIVSDRAGLLGEWSVQHGQAATRVESTAIQPGESIDLVADCRGGPSFDGFRWTVTLRLESADGGQQAWDSEAGFRGPGLEPPTAWEQLAHVLLMSNELVFVD